MPRSIQRLLFLLLSVLMFASCRRTEEVIPVHHGGGGPYCTLHSVVQSSGACKDSTEVYYDSAGRISVAIRHIFCAAGQPLISRKQYIYDAGRMFILDTSYKANKDTVTVDAALRIIDHQHADGTIPDKAFMAQYLYSPQGLLQSSVVRYSGTPPTLDSITYSFSNGDLREARGSNGTISYQYYDKYVPATGYITQNGLAFGSAFLYKNVHLLKSVQDGNGITTMSFAYTFDGFGNVASKISTPANGAASDTTKYGYMCAVE